MTKKISFIICILSISLIFSCSTTKEINSPELAYTKAAELLKHKNYSEAATAFEKIDDDFPFSKWATKGQVMALYAHYKNEEYEKVLQIADDFTHLNPSSEYTPYMLYMKGLCYYLQIPSIERAQDNTQQSSFSFRELIAKFPQSDYAFDAKEKLDFVDEHLAGSKMATARYQMKSKNYVGAIANLQEVILRYRYTKQVPEAYYRILEIYLKIGLNDEAQKALEKLQQKFPENNWTKLAEKINEKS